MFSGINKRKMNAIHTKPLLLEISKELRKIEKEKENIRKIREELGLLQNDINLNKKNNIGIIDKWKQIKNELKKMQVELKEIMH